MDNCIGVYSRDMIIIFAQIDSLYDIIKLSTLSHKLNHTLYHFFWCVTWFNTRFLVSIGGGVGGAKGEVMF